jgi:hypothetical protein
MGGQLQAFSAALQQGGGQRAVGLEYADLLLADGKLLEQLLVYFSVVVADNDDLVVCQLR